MVFNFNGVILSTKTRYSKDGKTPYYDINIDQDGDLITLPCTAEVSTLIGDAKYIPYRFQGTYTTYTYNNVVRTAIRVVGASPASAK